MARIRNRPNSGSTLSTPLTASAAAIPPETWPKLSKPSGDWVSEAWQRVDQVGELGFVVGWKRALLSRFRLVASDLDPDTGRPTGTTDNAKANQIVASIGGSTAGQSQMLGRFGELFTVAGEGYVAVIYPETGERWLVLSRDEIESSVAGTTKISLPEGGTYTLNDETDTLVRLWKPHGRKASEATSPVRTALPILREIVRMDQHIEAAGKSRLAGNGLLIIPDQVSMPTQQAPTGTPDPDAPTLPQPPVPPVRMVTAGDLQAELIRVAGTAIKDQASAEALVPIVLQCDGDQTKNFVHLTFGSDLTEQARLTREDAVKRLARTVDMPPEVLLGQGGLNHWNIWATDQQAVRWHSEPDMEAICDGLTRFLLRPMLDDENIVVWYSTVDQDSEDPSSDEQIMEGYKVGAVNVGAVLRSMGLSEDEDGYPTNTVDGWLAWAADAVRRDPSQFENLKPLIQQLVPGLAEPERPEPPAIPPAPRDVIDEDDPAEEALVAAGTARALEVAANRRRRDPASGAGGRLKGVPLDQTHAKLGPCPREDVPRLIEGWDTILCSFRGDVARIRARVEHRTAQLLTERQ